MIGTLIPEGAAPGSGRLNLEATLQIGRNRKQTRIVGTFREALVDGGFDYTPGIGWHTQPDPGHRRLQKPTYHGALCTHCKRPEPPTVVEPDCALFQDVRTGEWTSIMADGRVILGNVLDTPQPGVGNPPTFAQGPSA